MTRPIRFFLRPSELGNGFFHLMPSQINQRIGCLFQICVLLLVTTGCGQNEVPKQQLSEEALRLLDDIRTRTHNEFYARNARPLPGIKNGWPEFIGPLLQSLDDDDPQFVRRVADVLKRLNRRDIVREDEANAARTLLAYLGHEHATIRYHAARVLLSAIPAGRLGYLSKNGQELLLLWKPHLATSEQLMDQPDPRVGVFIAAAILRLDRQHAGALAYLRSEMETLKDEYNNHAFELSSSFPLLGDDARHLAPIAIRHAKFDGAWADPGLHGRADLEEIGTIAVPFIVQEISNSETSLNNQDFTLENEEWHRGNVLSFLSLLEVMAANSKFTGTDLGSASPLVKRLTESADGEIKKAAESTLVKMAQDKNGEAEKP